MSDWGRCRDNLDAAEKMHSERPFEEREMWLMAMQFDYVGTSGLNEDFKDHPIIKLLVKNDYL